MIRAVRTRGGGPLRVFLALAGLAVTTAGFYPEILTPNRILADYDVWTYFYPLRTYAVAALQGGRFPLWNPDIFLGAPFFANPQTSLLYPGTAVFLLVPVPYAYSLSVLLHVFLTAALTYAFLRVSIGVGAWPAMLGASAFAFGGSVSAQVGHINQLSSTPWLPAIALCADLAYRRRSLGWACLGVPALAVQLLAGHAQVTYMTLWVVGMLLVWRVSSDALAARAAARLARTSTEGAPETDPTPRSRPFLPLLPSIATALLVALLIGLPGGLLAAVQLIPTAELAAESVRGDGLSDSEATAFSLPPDLLVRALLPGYWANVSSTEFFGYVGTIPLFLALLALAFAVVPTAAFAASVAGLGIILALGGALPLYRALLEVVPGLDLFRVPARWLLIHSFGMSCLAAIGMEWALSRPLPTPSVWRPPVLVGAVTLLAVVSVPFLQAPGRIVGLWMLGFFAAALLVALAFREPGRAVAAAMTVLTIAELRVASISLPARSAVPADVYQAERDVPRHLVLGGSFTQGQSPRMPGGRILSVAATEYEVPDAPQLAELYSALSPEALFLFKTALKLDEVMSPNVPLRYGLATIDGYDGGVLPLRRYLELISLLVPRDELRIDGVVRTRLKSVPEERLLDFFGIRAVVALSGPDPAPAGLQQTQYPPLRVYDRPLPNPNLVSLVPRAEILPDEAALERLRVDVTSARITVHLAPESTLPADPTPGTGQFQRASRVPERINFSRVGPAGAGYLVVDDAWFPGWRAWVDGEETLVHRANVLFKAIWVPAEAQEVVFSYEPTSIRIGMVLSILGLAATGTLLLLHLRGRGLGLPGYNA